MLTTYDSQALWARWIDLWNGDLPQAEEIIHPTSPSIGSLPRRSRSVGGKICWPWVRQTRSLFAHAGAGPRGAARDPALVGAFGKPAARNQLAVDDRPNLDGEPQVVFRGNDIWRAEGGLIREYWLSDDLLDLMQQLGVLPSN